MDMIYMPEVVEPEPVSIPEDHPIRVSDRYGPGARLLRRWSLNGDGYPACVLDALDTLTASAEEIAEAEAANAAVREALDVPEPEAFVPPVPQTVSRFQARAALAMAGLLSQVDAAIAKSGNVIAQLAWADAQAFERNSPTIAGMAAALGLTDAQIDDLFRAASGIAA